MLRLPSARVAGLGPMAARAENGVDRRQGRRGGKPSSLDQLLCECVSDDGVAAGGWMPHVVSTRSTRGKDPLGAVLPEGLERVETEHARLAAVARGRIPGPKGVAVLELEERGTSSRARRPPSAATAAPRRE